MGKESRTYFVMATCDIHAANRVAIGLGFNDPVKAVNAGRFETGATLWKVVVTRKVEMDYRAEEVK